MSPVAPSGGHASRALIVASVAVVVVMGALWLAALAYNHKGSFKGVASSAPLRIGETKRLAPSIQGHGPLFLSDVSGHTGDPLDIIVQHLGTSDDHGWYVIRAQPARYAATDRSCTWQWRPASKDFRAACDHALTLPADGAGVRHYPVTVAKGELYVGLAIDLPTTTTTPASTTTLPVTGTPKGP